MASPDFSDSGIGMELRRLLDEVVSQEADHARRLVKAAAIVSEALRREGLEATVVGGSAIEIHAPTAYTTSDIDIVVPERRGVDWAAAQARAFGSLGFLRAHRHWARDDLFVEVPSRSLSDPVVAIRVGPFDLQVVAKEVVLADRVVGYRHWGATDYGVQAVAMLIAFGPELDEDLLHRLLEREGALDAYEALRRLAEAGEPIGRERLDAELGALRQRGHTDERES